MKECNSIKQSPIAALAAYGGGAGGTTFTGGSTEVLYVDDVFSTYVYDGTGAAQSITNGIDLSGEGGMVWTKCRSLSEVHMVFDTERGVQKRIFTNSDVPEQTSSTSLTAFNSDGFSIGTNNIFNTNGSANCSWSFRKAPKFFDIVTYTGTGSARTVAHNLGSVPGMIWIKCTSEDKDWSVYHRSLGATKNMHLNDNSVADTQTGVFNDTEPTATNFTVNYDGDVNKLNATYVAYLFAHDEQSFGTDSDEAIIKCGSWSGTGSAFDLDIGFEPQWIIYKSYDYAGDWAVVDNMRGLTVQGVDSQALFASTTAVESGSGNYPAPYAKGFRPITGNQNASGRNYVYMAIRRPNKPPETGTDVYQPIATTSATGTNLTTGFPVDWQLVKDNRTGTNGIYAVNRLTGVNTTDTENNRPYFQTSSLNAENSSNLSRHWDNTGYDIATPFGSNSSIYWNFRRAPGFFDVLNWSGNNTVGRAVPHNLESAPELVIIKSRSSGYDWVIWHKDIATSEYLYLNSTAAKASSDNYLNNTTPDASNITFSSSGYVNGTGETYTGFLFATLAGISKVGSYTGTGYDLNVDCGFTAGARFVMIKRIDDTGSWFVWDSARGINSGANDPYLRFNNVGAEINTDYIDPLNAGFTVNGSTTPQLNASGGTYLFLAVA